MATSPPITAAAAAATLVDAEISGGRATGIAVQERLFRVPLVRNAVFGGGEQFRVYR